jgi:type III pantothenate kinase
MAGQPAVVATGGHAPLIAHVAASVQHVNEHLTLEGLRLLWERRQPH